MNEILAQLDQQAVYDDSWFLGIRESLLNCSDEWLSAVVLSEGVSYEHAWNLLSWMRHASADLVRNPDQKTLELAIFARALLTQSGVDDRDIWVIVFLLRRGAQLAGVDYLAAVMEGCAAAGVLGESVYESLANASDKTPSTYEERGEGQDFSFYLIPANFDADKLLRDIGDGKAPLQPNNS